MYSVVLHYSKERMRYICTVLNEAVSGDSSAGIAPITLPLFILNFIFDLKIKIKI